MPQRKYQPGQGWEPEMPRGPRCGHLMKTGAVCVRRAGHPGRPGDPRHMSAETYRAQREAMDRFRAQWGTVELDVFRALKWSPDFLQRKRAEWRAGISVPGAGRS